MTPDRDALTPAYAAELLRRQDALQAEARAVLADLDLMRLLVYAGTPAQIGSSALGLMVWRDLDVIVASPGLSPAHAFAVMQPALAHPRVAAVRYANKSGAFNDAGKGQPRDPRYFFEIHYRTDTGGEGLASPPRLPRRGRHAGRRQPRRLRRGAAPRRPHLRRLRRLSPAC